MSKTVKINGVEIPVAELERLGFVRKENPIFDVPVHKQKYWFVLNSSCVVFDIWDGHTIDEERLMFYNVFPSREMAEKAAEMMRRSNAIIHACLLVDPDFEPDWNNAGQSKWFVYYNHNKGKLYMDFDGRYQKAPAYVSSKEKANQVIELLKKWGVK